MSGSIGFRIKNTDIKIHFLSVLSVAALCFAESSIYSLIVVLCAAVHEAGHAAMIKKCGAGIRELRFLPFGAEMRMAREVSYRDELLIAVAGPAMNILLSVIFFCIFVVYPSAHMLFAAICSLFSAVINLVPIRGFDGGRIVRCAAFMCLEYEKALTLVRSSELLSLIIFTLLSMAAVIFSSFNLSLTAICIYLFVSVYRNS